MSSSPLARCPGCGLELPSRAPAEEAHPGASAACWQAYSELAARTLTDRDPTFPHQMAVDAYAAQHASPASKPITIAFALIGLHLACERQLTGREAQRVHMVLARRRQEWPVLEPPRTRGSVTVADPLAAAAGARAEALRRWAASVWAAWHPQHDRVAALLRERLDGDVIRPRK